MGSVGTPVVRRMIDVARTTQSREELLASVGLSPDAEGPGWAGEAVDEEAYYDLIERMVAPGDHDFPFRYADALAIDDLGALGLALKTAPTVAEGLQRMVRYILVLSDTLEYEMIDRPGGWAFALTGRPHHRRGAALANECALAATTSVLRQIVAEDLTPVEVSFRHLGPSTDADHRRFFGSPVRFSAPLDAVHLDARQLATPTRLADEGLSAYLLAQLDDLKSRTAQRSLVDAVRGAITDALPDGQPSKSQIARRLGMSERTLHRHLADHGHSFQTLATGARREAAVSLLASDGHSLADVAFLTGFSDQTAFTRAFKRWTGTTPAAFRRQSSRSEEQ